jgi:hypothetical protein
MKELFTIFRECTIYVYVCSVNVHTIHIYLPPNLACLLVLACESVQINAVYYIHHPTSRKKIRTLRERQTGRPAQQRPRFRVCKNPSAHFLHREPRLQKVQIAQLAWGETVREPTSPPPPFALTHVDCIIFSPTSSARV